MYEKEVEKNILDLVRFKSHMRLNLSIKKAQYIWGKGVIKRLSGDTLRKLDKGTKTENSQTIKKKIDIAKENLNILFVLNWVRFVGISGSVAAGFAKEEDDIDIFVVVRDGCAWIYRGVLTLKNIFKRSIRSKRDGKDVKDLLCINFIVEEKGLELENDIFNFHELMYLIPIYNEMYLNYIYGKNSWLQKDFSVNKDLLRSRERSLKRVNIFVRVINFFAFLAQVFFMLLTGHQPEVKRLFSNYREGRIEFFPAGYKKRIIDKQ